MEELTPAPSDSARLLRIRALSAEMDAQRQFAIDRGKTQETKASFILVVVGLVAGISSTQLASTSWWAVGLIPIALALTSAAKAALVLWPRTLDVVDADALVNMWIDSNQEQEQVEDYLLESKKQEIVARDKKNATAMPHLRWAFRLLLISLVVLFTVAVVEGLVSTTPTPPPAPMTPGATP